MSCKIKQVTVAPGCIACGTCQVVCPEVFQVTDVCAVKEDADLVKHVDCINEAASMCPVGVIQIEQEANKSGES